MRRGATVALAVAASLLFVDVPLEAAKPRAVRPRKEPRVLTSFEKIDAAVESGAIDRDTALLYKVFSTFGDTRLPGAYRAAATEPNDSMIMREVRDRFDDLPPSMKDAVTPFLIPPMYAGSWHDLATAQASTLKPAAPQPPLEPCEPSSKAWKSVSHEKYALRIWWQTRFNDEAAAELLAEAGNEIWKKLTDHFPAPPDDGGRNTQTDCRGGDGRVDVMLVEFGIPVTFEDPDPRKRDRSVLRGLATPYPSDEPSGVGCPSAAGFIQIERRLSARAQKSVLAHEVMHLVQFGFERQESCAEYSWLEESTANWARDFVYPDISLEHGFASVFLETPEFPLDSRSGHRDYGAYLFPYFLACPGDTCARNTGQPILGMWMGTRTRSSLDAVNDAINGGFDEQWPKFTLANWNAGPVNHYQNSDDLTTRAFTMPLASTAPTTHQLLLDMSHLSAQYFHQNFEGSKIRSILFMNGARYWLKMGPPPGILETYPVYYLENAPLPSYTEKMHVRALTRTGDRWSSEFEANWDRAGFAVYCQDKTAQRLDELLLVFSNSQHDPNAIPGTYPRLPPTIVTSDIGCDIWKGKLTFTSSKSPMKITWDLTFKRSGGNGPSIVVFGPGQSIPIEGFYYSASGAGEWSMNGSRANGCTYSGGGTVPAKGSMRTYDFVPEGLMRRAYVAHISGPDVTVHQSCPNSSGSISVPLPEWGVDIRHPFVNPVITDGSRITGAFTNRDGETWSWTFESNP